MTKIADLFAELGLKDEKFRRGLDSALGQARKFGGALKSALLPATAALTALGAGATAAIVKVTSMADEIAKTAQRIGISTDALQQMRFAARQTGVDAQLLNVALTAMVRRADEARRGNKAFAEGFQRLGITINDLKNLSPEQLLFRIADGLQRMSDQSARVAALDAVMSEAGRKIVNTFNGGSESLNRFFVEGQRLGQVIPEKLLRDAEALSDAFDKVKGQLQATFATAVLQNAEALTDAVDRFGAALPGIISGAIEFAKSLESVAKSLGLINRTEAEKEIRALGVELDLVGGALRRLNNTPDIINFLNPFVAAERDAEEFPKRINAIIDRLAELGITVAQNKDGTFNLFRVASTGAKQAATETRKFGDELRNVLVSRADREKPLELIDVKEVDLANIMVEKMRNTVKNLEPEFDENHNAAQIWLRSVSDGLADAILKADSFGGALKGILLQLAKAELSNLIGGIIGVQGGGSILGGLFGRATGGGLQPGVPTVVGERGPELVTSAGGGRVASASETRFRGGGGLNINVTQNIRFDVGLESVDTRISQAAPTLLRAARDGTIAAMQRPRFA